MELRAKLEIEAKRHATSLNNEIRLRLEDSFTEKAHRDIWKVAEFIQVVWLKLSATLKERPLANEMAEAILQGASADHVRALARQWKALQQALERPVLLEGSPFLKEPQS
jgi:hypothetical protein